MRKVDVLIVGGGLVGCAVAYYLAKRGVDVLLVERDFINAGASGRNAGSLHFQIEPRMVDRLRADPAMLRHLVPVSRQASEDWKRLPGELGTDLEVELRGGVVVGETAADRDTLERKVALENDVGLPTRMVEAAELRALVPAIAPEIRFGAWCADEGHANPRLVTPAYARAAQRAGAQLRAGVEARSFAASGDKVQVELAPVTGASIEAIEAGAVVIASGAWSTPVLADLGITVPLRPIGLTMNITEKLPPTLSATVQHIGKRLSIKQLASGNVIIGGSWPAKLAGGPAWPRSASLDQDAILGNLQTACHVIPAVAQAHLLRAWSGIASDTPDHLPLLGEVAAGSRIYVAAGGSSFTLGPTYARLLSELICDGATSLPLDMYRPDRFADQPCLAA